MKSQLYGHRHSHMRWVELMEPGASRIAVNPNRSLRTCISFQATDVLWGGLLNVTPACFTLLNLDYLFRPNLPPFFTFDCLFLIWSALKLAWAVALIFFFILFAEPCFFLRLWSRASLLTFLAPVAP